MVHTRRQRNNSSGSGGSSNPHPTAVQPQPQQQQQQQDDDNGVHNALLLLLQHEVAMSDSQLICKLQATSRALQAAVATQCGGRLALTFGSRCRGSEPHFNYTKQQAKEASFGAWLAKHAHLLKALHMQDITFMCFGRDTLAPALRAAAASPAGLASFSSDWDDANAVEVVQQLPAATLTHLRMCITEPCPDDDAFGGYAVYDDCDEFEMEDLYYEEKMYAMQAIRTKHDTPAMAAVLARLTNLASLSIHGYETLLDSSPVLCGLSCLTALTKLSIAEVLPSFGVLRHLPAQLVELEVMGTARAASGYRATTPLALAHLTALTRLHTGAPTGRHAGLHTPRVDLVAADVLPPNLVSLCVATCDASLKPLVALTALRRLSLAQLAGAGGNGSAGGGNGSGGTEQACGEDEAASLQQLRQRLPGLDVRVALPGPSSAGLSPGLEPGGPGRAAPQCSFWCCHCCTA